MALSNPRQPEKWLSSPPRAGKSGGPVRTVPNDICVAFLPLSGVTQHWTKGAGFKDHTHELGVEGQCLLVGNLTRPGFSSEVPTSPLKRPNLSAEEEQHFHYQSVREVIFIWV